MADEQNTTREPTTTGTAAVTDYLDGQGVRYELLEHESTMTAAAEAAATHRPPHRVAKTVVLQDRAGYVLAIVPASERLDLHKLREFLGATASLRLATEDEMARDFPAIEVGATPPAGPMLPRAEVVDRRLLDEDRIVCPAGDHRHSLLLDPRDVVKLAGAEVADVCAD
ncbi:MAG TPA: YbaK/EbsC family protein [Thermoleophilaceae bacterium]|jgi:Ala-tRNA(Pro) deacylase